MDQRLKDVHQTELTESRINEDFVDFLKTKGPQYMLLILIGICGYLGILRWKQHKTNYYNEAWVALLECRLPGAFEDVASKYSDVPGLPQQALKLGADTLLQAVLSDRPLAADPTSPMAAQGISDDERIEYMDRAERLYQAVVDSDNDSLAMTLHAVSAMQGLAVIAESRGDIEDARLFYEMAAERAEPYYPALARRVRDRAATVDEYEVAVVLPAQADLPANPPGDPLESAVIGEALGDLLLPDDSGDG